MDKFLVVDFETTGNRAKDGDQIIQIGAVLIENKEIVSQFSSLINPGMPIPPFIQQLTGINDKMVEDAPYIEEILPQLLPFLDGAVFVAHNVFFDLGFLQQALLDCGYLPFSGPKIDTVELSRLLLPEQSGYRLSDLSFEFEVEHENPHQADSDALATAHIFLALLKRMEQLPLTVLQRLGSLVRGFSTDLPDLFAHIEQQRFLKAEAYEDQDGLDYYRQLALQYRERKEQDSDIENQSNYESFQEFMEELNRRLPEEMESFEWREAQRDMMKEIYQAFEDKRHLLIEAGTGTGKSLGYLIPAAFWARKTGNRVVISTHTIQLQEQLFNRDIPLVSKFFDQDLSVSILKGRNNYLCLRKFEGSLNESFENYDIQLSKGQILTWLTETRTGDLEEINLPSGGRAYLRQVQSDANSCLNRQCPWFSRCFYHHSRQSSQDAEVIITNHSLLLTDLQADQRILPSYKYAILDEAHHFEDVASQQLGASLHSVQIEGTFQQIVSDKGIGICDRLEKEINQAPKSLESILQSLQKAREMASDARLQIKDLLTKLYEWGIRRASDANEANRAISRMFPEKWGGEMERTIRPSLNTAIEWYSALVSKLSSVYQEVQDELEVNYALRGILTDLQGIIKELNRQRELLQFILIEQKEDYVYWMEMDTRSNRKGVYLFVVPLHVAPLLQEQFFENKQSVVLTSATLSVKGSFGYTVKRLGLENSRVEAIHYHSPFDYRSQSLLCIPSDFPSIKGENDQLFLDRVASSLIQLAQRTKGRMLVLFTSYQMLREVYDRLKGSQVLHSYSILGHNIDSNSRTKLTKQFKNTPKSILLGTNSFWEGVDIPGDALSCLVIVRLPFLPPNHPLTQARGDDIKQKKGNPFMEMSIPQAVIRFKQGFGRLVRTQTDRGVVVIFDKRIMESRYGSYFLRSLPDLPIHYEPFQDLLPLVQDWLKQDGKKE